MRYLILIHRYLGTAIGIVMVGWCLSGIVMMYVRYPALTATERLQNQQPLDLRRCCVIGASALPVDARLEAIEVESLAEVPVLRVQFADGGRRLIDLTKGEVIATISAQRAADIAKAGQPQTPRLLGLIAYDEWTVSGEFNGARPLYRFARDDPSGTQLYVSAKTGRIVQVTTAHQRFWNWLGAVPHWLYFSQLRRHPALWSRIIIWTSLAGSFLTGFGIYIGVRQFLRRPAGRWSSYRGVLYWHHVPGLIFGLFALTWVASGLISMNPWGFLDSDGGAPGVGALIGPPIGAAQLTDSLRTLAAHSHSRDIVALQSTRLWGQPYWIETRTDGSHRRIDSGGRAAALQDADWRRIGKALGAPTDSMPALMTAGDSYYYSRPGVTAQFPVYRLVLHDAHRTRFYLDPLTGTPVNILDADGRWYRWLHIGLHTLDFARALRIRPVWDVVMLILLAGVTLVCGLGTWLGWRRYLPMGARRKKHQELA
jgi:hypothetical protein